MTSKELNEIFNKTRRTENISLTVEQIKDLIKDLEILEILKKHLKEDAYYNGAFIDFTELSEEEKEKIIKG